MKMIRTIVARLMRGALHYLEPSQEPIDDDDDGDGIRMIGGHPCWYCQGCRQRVRFGLEHDCASDRQAEARQ